jgi:hypothetical protein
MATFDPIQAGPLKITFPANLPKNEKDLICMLLAGRLKDLWKGRLICAQLSINDLLKQTAGIDGLGVLRKGLNDLNASINKLKAVSGYNDILNTVNKALSQVENVFSLGGLCPSPVHAPKIPDLIGKLNQNLFGQANNILNALARASNPSMCLGGGPGGLGINWNSMTGDLAALNAAIAQFKRDPAGFNSTIKAFEDNLKYQTQRMNAEVDRLKKNLSDPLGINQQQKTAQLLTTTTNKTADYTVKDKNGVQHTNPLRSMIPADVEHVLNRTPNTITTWKTVPILDYCGDIVGYKKVAVTGDPDYIGFTTNPAHDDLNVDKPTVNPIAEYKEFDYSFWEENSKIVVYNSVGQAVTDIALKRGISYKIGFRLITKSIQFYQGNASTVWYSGLQISSNPKYGIGSGYPGMKIITPDKDFQPTFSQGEVDWSVSIENPVTPDALIWKTTDNSASGRILVSGIKSIPNSDKTYDLSMAFKKAFTHLENKSHSFTLYYDFGHLKHVNAVDFIPDTVPLDEDLGSIISPTPKITIDFGNTINPPQDVDLGTITEPINLPVDFGTVNNPSDLVDDFGELDEILTGENSVAYQDHVTNRRYNIKINLRLDDGTIHTFDNNLIWGTGSNNYQVIDDTEHLDGQGLPIPDNKIIKWVTKLNDSNYLVQKWYVNGSRGLELNEISFYITPSITDESSDTSIAIVSMNFETPFVLLNDTNLSYSESYHYKISYAMGKTPTKDGDFNVYNSDEAVFSLVGDSVIRWNLTTTTDVNLLTDNEFVCYFDVKFDPRDPDRSFINTNPTINKMKYYGRGVNNTYIDYTITYIDQTGPTVATTPVNGSATKLENGRDRAGISGSSYGIGILLN